MSDLPSPRPAPAPTRRAAESRRAAVRLDGVTRLFGEHAALVRIDLSVACGEVVLLRGHNGAGKTTLLHIIATLIAPTWGRGAVLGHDLNRERRAIRARAELLSHRTRLYDDLTPSEYLRFIAVLDGRVDSAAIDRALESVGLRAEAGERIRAFSQGMRQRVGLARAYLRKPRLLLLDEPYSTLDAAARMATDELIVEVKNAGGSVLIATHDTTRATVVADRAVELVQGRVVCDEVLS